MKYRDTVHLNDRSEYIQSKGIPSLNMSLWKNILIFNFNLNLSRAVRPLFRCSLGALLPEREVETVLILCLLQDKICVQRNEIPSL